MKRSRLPLTALRSFEAAGRHASFSRAAVELYVSQAAISRQVRELETMLGTPLFRRLHRKVELTDAGQHLLVDVSAAFNAIDHALGQISEKDIARPVRLTIDPAIAALWLMPRMKLFHAEHPDIELELLVDERVVDFRSGEADIGLRFSHFASEWPGTETIKLLDAFETPMLTPALLAELPSDPQPSDLTCLTLLHGETRQNWQDWFRAANVEESARTRPAGPMLADPALTRQAAVLGHGVTLGDTFLLQDDLARGALVMPFDLTVQAGRYWIAAHDFAALDEKARSVVTWIKAQIINTAETVRPRVAL